LGAQAVQPRLSAAAMELHSPQPHPKAFISGGQSGGLRLQPHILLLKAARVHRLCARANSIAVVVVVVVVVGVGGQDGRGIEAPGDDDAILSHPVLVIFPETSTSLIFFTP